MFLCDRCHRHVRERVCPFCKAAVRAETEVLGGRAMQVGVLRGALLVGAATASALAGCREQQPQTIMQPYGVPIPPPDVVSVGEVYGVPGQGNPPETIAQPYGVPMPPPDALEAPAVAQAYGVPVPQPPAPDAGARTPPPTVVQPYGVPIPRRPRR